MPTNNPEDNLEEKVEDFKRENPDIFIEVVLLTKADLLGGQLNQINPEKFNFKIDFLNKIVSSY